MFFKKKSKAPIEIQVKETIPIRVFDVFEYQKGYWAIIADKENRSLFVFPLTNTQIFIISGLRKKKIKTVDCGIYSSLLEQWAVFGMSPKNLNSCLEGNDIFSYVELLQKNELGSFLGRVYFSLADIMILSEMLNTPVSFHKELVSLFFLKNENSKDIIEIAKNIISEYISKK